MLEAAEDKATAEDVLATAPWSALIVTDPGGRILSWSSGAERLYGWSRHEVLGRPVIEVVVPAEMAAAAELIMEGLRQPSSSGWKGPFPVMRKNGSVIEVFVYDQPVVVDGTVVAVIGESAPVMPAKGAPSGPEPLLVEQLTERERDVLRLLPTFLGRTEIAGLLNVSTNTVKSHLKSIYRKLGVTSRDAAVMRAASTRLLGGDPAEQQSG